MQVRIDQDLEGSRKNRIWKLLKFLLGQIYLPSKFSLLVLSIFALGMFLLGHLTLPNFFFINSPLFRITLNENDFQNLIAISAGIGTIIFALIIFIAESLREDAERARVLLRESLLYPLTFFGISILVMFLWFDVTYLSVVSVVFLAGFAIFAISKMIRVLLNRSLFLTKEQDLFKDRVKKSIDRALRLRVGNNIYLKRLEDDKLNIDYSIFDEEKEGYIVFSLVDIGVITDIDMCLLDELFVKLEALANKKDCTFTVSGQNRSVDENSLDVNTELSETETIKQKQIKGYILKKLGDELTGDRQAVLTVPKILFDTKKSEEEIESCVRFLFTVNSKPEESLSEQLRDELNRKHDSAIEAIRSGKTRKLEEVADHYVSAAASFLEVIKEVGGGYSQKDARRERGAIIGGWDEVKWVSKDLSSMLNESIEYGSKEAVKTISHVPIAISIKAIRFSDHFVFQEFVRFQTFLYELSQDTKDKKIKTFLIDRSWRYLKEMADFYVAAELNKQRPIQELENFRDFGIDIMQIFQALLKQAFSKRDTSSYELFAQAIAKLFDHFNPSEEYPSGNDYKMFLKNDKLVEKEKTDLQEKLARQEVLENLELAIKQRKEELFFGISGWILGKFSNKNFDDEVLQKFWEITNRYLPEDIVKLFEVYQRVHGFDTEDFWGWDWWEMEGQPEGVVNSIDVSSKFDWLFCVKALQTIKDLPREKILNIKIEAKRDLVYLIEKEDSAVKSRLNQIKENEEKWLNVLSQEAIDKTDDLKSLLDSLVAEVERKEQEFLISAQLDQTKTNSFYNDFISSFFKSAGLRDFFKTTNNYVELKRNTSKKIGQWGFNQIDNKEAFLKDWHVSYGDWGKHYGEELGSAEDFRLFQDISKNLRVSPSSTGGLNEKIIDAIEFLVGENYRPSVILTTTYPGDFYRSKSEESGFVPHYQVEKSKYKAISGFIGVFRYKNSDIPVIEVGKRPKDSQEEVCIVDMKKFAKLVQHVPYMKDSEKSYKRRIFIFRIIDLNSDDKLRQDILDKKYDWLEKYESPETYLRQKVITNILERFELRVIDKKAGVKFAVQKD